MVSRFPPVKYWGVLILLACLLFFAGLNHYQLRGSTEPRVAGIAQEVVIDGDWVVPRLNGTPFLEKPPLSLWLDATGISLFGSMPVSVRLPSALAGLFTVLVLLRALMHLQRPRALAWLAGALLITMAQFWANVRQVGEDALLTLGITLALLAFVRADIKSGTGTWLLFALGIAIASLSKGVFGLAVPGAVILAYLGCKTLWFSKRLVVADWLRPAAATLLGLVPLALWLWLLYQRVGMPSVVELLWANSMGRFSGDFETGGHFEPIYYYWLKLPQFFLPWNILTFLGLWRYCRQARRDRFSLFLCCWLIAPFILLSLSSGKRMVYLLALYPAAAVIAADWCLHALEEIRKRSADSRAARWLQSAHRPVVVALLTIVALSYLAYATLVLPRGDDKESFAPLFAQVAALKSRGGEIALYRPSERLAGATVFYTASRAPELHTARELSDFLARSQRHVAVLEEGTEPAPDSVSIVNRFQVGKRSFFLVADPAAK